MPIPPKGSIPGRKPKGRSGDRGVDGFLESLLEGLGKTIRDIQNLNLDDLEKLAEVQGNKEAKEKINKLKGALGEKGISDLFNQGSDLNKLIKLATKQGVVRTGLRGRILGRPFGGDLPLDRRGPQETTFEVGGTRSKPAPKTEKPAPEMVEVQEPEMEVYREGNHIKVVGEIPGVGEENVRCEVKKEGKILRISAEGRRKYEKEISLPAQVSQEADWRYQNGVLEITLTKKGGA